MMRQGIAMLGQSKLPWYRASMAGRIFGWQRPGRDALAFYVIVPPLSGSAGHLSGCRHLRVSGRDRPGSAGRAHQRDANCHRP
jgi:hypothetical protein